MTSAMAVELSNSNDGIVPGVGEDGVGPRPHVAAVDGNELIVGPLFGG